MAFSNFKEILSDANIDCINLPEDNPTWRQCVAAVEAYRVFCENHNLGDINAFIIEPAELKTLLGLSTIPDKAVKIYMGVNDKGMDNKSIHAMCVAATQTNDGKYVDVDVPIKTSDIDTASKAPSTVRPCPPQCKLVVNILNP